jgi:hypothetical protein
LSVIRNSNSFPYRYAYRLPSTESVVIALEHQVCQGVGQTGIFFVCFRYGKHERERELPVVENVDVNEVRGRWKEYSIYLISGILKESLQSWIKYRFISFRNFRVPGVS